MLPTLRYSVSAVDPVILVTQICRPFDMEQDNYDPFLASRGEFSCMCGREAICALVDSIVVH